MLKIDEEFRMLCPPLSSNERELLEASLLEDGLRDPICVWDNVIVDGHNRYELCQKHKIKMTMRKLRFSERCDAKKWILTNQLGRRNLGNIQASYLRGRLYLDSRKIGNKGRQTNVAPGVRTQEIVAKLFSVSPGAIRNDTYVAEAIDKLTKRARDYAMSRDVFMAKQHVIDLSKLEHESQDLIVDQIKAGRIPGLEAAILRLRAPVKTGDKGPSRCAKCGGKLAVGVLTCLACDVDKKEVERRIMSPTPITELPDGWQERLEYVRAAKKAVGDAGGEEKIIYHCKAISSSLSGLTIGRNTALHFALAKLFMALKEKVGKGHGTARFSAERQVVADYEGTTETED